MDAYNHELQMMGRRGLYHAKTLTGLAAHSYGEPLTIHNGCKQRIHSSTYAE